MSKFSTLNYLINSIENGEKNIESLRIGVKDLDDVMDFDVLEYEPSKKCIDAILSFASQYDVLKSTKAGDIELNLN